MVARRFLLTLILAVSFASSPPALAACGDGELRVRAPTLSGDERTDFEAQFQRALKRVCRWWGGDFAGPFAVDIDESRGPSMALVPAWRGKRGEMLFRAGTVRLGRAAITHEIVHVVAPNANRFLAEGLAVYAQSALRGQPAYPNFAKDLTAEAFKLRDRADIAALERLATPARLELPGLDGREAYIVAGSFVGYLIERFGLEKFQELYALTPLDPLQREPGAPDRWVQVYGLDLAMLTSDWRTALAGE